jgi:subtilisin family serine protease
VLFPALLLLSVPLSAAPRDLRSPTLSPGLARAALDLDGQLQVLAETDSDAYVLAAALDLLGFEVEAVAEGQVQLRTTPNNLEQLANHPDVLRARAPRRAQPKVESEGVANLFLDEDWRTEGLRGRGVKVAVLDIGFDGWEEAVEQGELPDNTRLDDSNQASTHWHGTAVAEIISDVAPRAKLRLYPFQTETEFLVAVAAAEDWGAEVVNASVGFDNTWPADGTSPYTRAADQLATESDVLWVNAAGNENLRYRIGALTDTDGDGIVEIDGTEGTWVATDGDSVDVRFRWTDPMGAATTDLDLSVWTAEGVLCGESTEPQDGQGSDPIETLEAECAGTWVEVIIEVANGQADPESLLAAAALDGFLYGVDGILDAAATGAMNLTLPADLEHGLAVGACDWVYGTAASYSSRGPTEDGRLKPDLCAPTGVSTWTTGDELFAGTSSSAPHVSGLGALLLGSDAADSAADARNWLYDEALDLGEEGPDTTFGFGAAVARAAPGRDCGCAASATARPSGLWLVLAIGLAARRRAARVAMAAPKR